LTSRYDLDCQEISRIQFHTNLPDEEKNALIKIIEKRMNLEEQKDLDGKVTEYYND